MHEKFVKLSSYVSHLEGPMYIDFLVYEEHSDHIKVPLTVWEKYATSTDTPTFMRVNGGPVGRIVPAEINDSCRIPSWMWSLCGEPLDFVELEVVILPIATSITLKPRNPGEPVALEDMTAAISASWASLTAGATLQLVCGTYDVISILAVDTEVPAACILDCDVVLDLISYGNEGQEETHSDVIEPEIDFSQMFTAPKPELFPGQGRTIGGKGRRLGP